MAELGWSKAQTDPLTFRELFLIYQNALESRWNFRAAMLSEIHNITVATIRLNSKATPKATSPADFNPYRARKEPGKIITPENFEESCKALGDQMLATLQSMS